jgi:hypothetical protein
MAKEAPTRKTSVVTSPPPPPVTAQTQHMGKRDIDKTLQESQNCENLSLY